MNNSDQTIPQTIESILFATAESYTVAALAKLIDLSNDEIEVALLQLSEQLEGHAIMLVRHGESVTLATRAEYAALLEGIRKEELQKDLSKASAETMAVIVYHPGATKAEIELIRGVNASYSLRALQIRGLVEGKPSGHTIAYYPTLALLEQYGVADTSQLPQYSETVQKINALLGRESEEV
jgi:segregation and condensation protein B